MRVGPAGTSEDERIAPLRTARDDGGAGGYEIVAGERRRRAHQLAGLTEIKAIVTDDGLSEIERFKRSVAENINRADMTPMEEAKAFRRLLNEQEGAEARTSPRSSASPRST